MMMAVIEAASWSGCAAIFVMQLAARWVAVAAGALQCRADQQGGNAGALSSTDGGSGGCENCSPGTCILLGSRKSANG